MATKAQRHKVKLFAKMENRDDKAKKRIGSIEDLKGLLSMAKAFRIENNRPLITISYAQSVDGSIAARDRRPIQLSGPESSVLTHQIRACCDAILIGIGTLLADDPQLSVRLAQGDNPQPIVLDTRLRTPLKARLVQQTNPGPWIINADYSREDRKSALKNAGSTPITCPTAADGKIDLYALMKILSEMEINSIMVEGGAKVITSFIRARLVDQFIITVSPRLVGGLPVIDSNGLNLESNLTLNQISYQHSGQDLTIWARPVWKG